MYDRSTEETKKLIRQFSYEDEEIQRIFEEVIS